MTKKPSERRDSRVDRFVDHLLLPIAALLLVLAIAVYLLDVWLP